MHLYHFSVLSGSHIQNTDGFISDWSNLCSHEVFICVYFRLKRVHLFPLVNRHLSVTFKRGSHKSINRISIATLYFIENTAILRIWIRSWVCWDMFHPRKRSIP